MIGYLLKYIVYSKLSQKLINYMSLRLNLYKKIMKSKIIIKNGLKKYLIVYNKNFK